MRQPLSAILALFLAVGAQAQQAPVNPSTTGTPATSKFMLEDATPVRLRLSRNVSSADAETGDTVDFEVLEEVKIGDVLVIPKGGIAWGTVTEAQHKRRMARGGKLNMTIDNVRLVDGEKVALRGVREGSGGGHTGAMTGGMVATFLVVWPAAPLFLFMHGKDITYPKGTEITAYINGNCPLDATKFAAQGGPVNGAHGLPQTSVQAPTAQDVTLKISSMPSGAEIEIDGNFVGDTPSSVGVHSGDHSIKITKNGYSPWERKLSASTGTVELSPELEPAAQPAAK